MTPPQYVGEGYPQTGLYFNTDPPELIYLVTSSHGAFSYFNRQNVFISNDGMHFAYFPIPFHNDNIPRNIPASRDDNTEITAIAIEFYNGGNLIKQYSVSDLVMDNSKLVFSISMVKWEKGVRSFDPESNTVTLKTADDITYVFDIKTGEILESNKEDFPIVPNDGIDMREASYGQSSYSNLMINGSLLWIGSGILSVALIIMLIVIIKKKRKGTK